MKATREGRCGARRIDGDRDRCNADDDSGNDVGDEDAGTTRAITTGRDDTDGDGNGDGADTEGRRGAQGVTAEATARAVTTQAATTRCGDVDGNDIDDGADAGRMSRGLRGDEDAARRPRTGRRVAVTSQAVVDSSTR
jgi:hypothetical protein